MSTFGRTVIGTTGIPVQVSADGRPEWKQGGITLDWSTVTPYPDDTTLPDGYTVKAGAKALLFGTVVYLNTGTGKFQPALSGTTLVRGETYILNETVFEKPIFGFGTIASDHPAVFDGGRVWIARVQASAAGPVNGMTVTAAGSGFTSVPAVAFSGGGGSGAAATAIISGGVVTGFLITAGGTGYTSAPTVAITGGGGTGATATATVGSTPSLANLLAAMPRLSPVEA